MERFQEQLKELEWQERIGRLAIQEKQPVPKMPLPKDGTLVVQILSHKDELHGIINLEQKKRYYFFCAYYKLPKT